VLTKHQHAAGGGTTITLSDNTAITFAGVSSPSAADFSTIAGASKGNGDSDDHGQRDQGHGETDGDDRNHIRDMPVGHSDH
jgi:hypothetical protein